MSLEDAIKENTEAVKQLTAVMEARSGAGSPGAKANEAKKAEKAGSGAKPTGSGNKKTGSAGKGKAAPKVQRKDVTTVMLELANEYSRDYAIEVLAEFGVKKASDLKDDQLADAKAAFEKKLKQAKEEAAGDDPDEDDDPLGEGDEDEGDDEDFDLD